ncbi:MAG: tetratricopeptide repeat protein [candidate division Zixibacteria bacterium]|nr:tetratricopeptide repeat protein [candidate division Zixibacteria bacterium]
MYYRNKDYDKSISNYKSIIKDFKDSELDEIANIWIGLAILKKGDTTNAITQFENFVKEFPNSEDIEYVEGRLRGLKGIPEKNNN